MRFIDLFCGLGAFHQSLAKQGHECVFACDIDDGVRKLYENNYGVVVAGDVKAVEAKDIPPFDILCGGFPCQSFSIAGKKLGFDDETRGTLFHEIVRIVRFHSPKYVVLENVKNLANHDDGNTMRVVREELDRAGYHVSWCVMNACDFGVPQCRERIYIVGVRKDEGLERDGVSNIFGKVKKCDRVRCVREIINRSHDRDMRERLLERYEIKEKKAVGGSETERERKPKQVASLVLKSSKKGGRQGERVYSIDYPGVTVCCGSGGPGANTGLYDVDGAIRTLCVDEVLAMFGFPADYKRDGITDKKMINYLGNSICVPVLDALFGALLN